MATILEPNFKLLPFQPPAWTQGWQIEGRAHRSGEELALSYCLTGLRTPLAWPAGASNGGRFAHNLWQHTCFELFLKTPLGPRYWEWNFSPSGDWAHYSFTDYRTPDVLPSVDSGLVKLDTEIVSPEEFWLHIKIRPSFSSVLSWAWITRQPLQIGLSAILENQQGDLSYWALAHAGVRADFHLAQSFTLRL